MSPRRRFAPQNSPKKKKKKGEEEEEEQEEEEEEEEDEDDEAATTNATTSTTTSSSSTTTTQRFSAPPPRRAASIASSLAITSALTNYTTINPHENNTNPQGSTLSPSQVMILDLLRRIRRKGDCYGFFSRPVDPVLDDCSDYYTVIPSSQAMDFHTLERNVRSGLCATLDSFESCVARIVDNAMAYNKDATHPVYIEAKVLKEAAEPMVDSVRWKFNRKGYGGEEKKAENTRKAKREVRSFMSRSEATMPQRRGCSYI